jgi:hypothetical protein
VKRYIAFCAAIEILLGWWFVWDCQRYDNEHYRVNYGYQYDDKLHRVNDDYERWTPADWKRWKELHSDKPKNEGR